MEELLEMLRQKEDMEAKMEEADCITVDDYLLYRNQIFERLLMLRPELIERLKWSWCHRYNYIDPADVESYIYESVLVAIENFKPSLSENFNCFLWNISKWSVKTLVMETLKRKESSLPEYEDLEIEADPSEQLQKKMLIERIHSEVSDVCKRIIDGLSVGQDYTEIGNDLVTLTGRKLFPSEISYWVKTMRTQYQELLNA